MPPPRSVVGESALAKELSSTAALVVVDFWAGWCGPCLNFAPKFEAIAKAYPDVVFLKVKDEESKDAMQARAISALPTFHLYVKSSLLDKLEGADEGRLRALIETHKGKGAAAFSGAGVSLGGAAAAAASARAPDAVREARLKAMGLGGGGGAPAAAAAVGGAAAPSAAPAAATAPSAAAQPAAAAAAAAAAPPSPRPAASIPAPKPVSAEALASLEGMSFPRNRSVRALHAVGGTSFEAALDWIQEHQEDAGIDDDVPAAWLPLPSSSGGAGSAMDVEITGGSGGGAATAEEALAAQVAADAEYAASLAGGGGDVLKCSVCNARVRGQSGATAHAKKTGHQDFEQSDGAAGGGGGGGGDDMVDDGPPAKKLTPEELQAKVVAMRAAKAAAAKEDERAKEIKRRAEGAKSEEAKEALRKTSLALAEARAKREKEAVDREALFQRLELAKERAERDVKSHGKVSEESAARLKHYQDLWDGKASVLVVDPAEAVKSKIKALTLQKAEDIGLGAARTIAALLSKVVESPGEAKYRRVPWAAGKAAYQRIAPAAGALALLTSLGWVKETDDAGTWLSLPSAAPLDLLSVAIAEIRAAEEGGRFK